MPTRSVTVICPNLSTNCLGRAMLLADLVPSDERVRIVGWSGGAELWAPAREHRVPIVALEAASPSGLYAHRRDLRSALRNDVVIASKPLWSSLGLALASGIEPGRLIVDVDDDELGLQRRRGSGAGAGVLRLAAAAYQSVHPGRFNTPLSTWALEDVVRRLPHRLVSNARLQSKFGGERLPHVRDPGALDPAESDPARMRAFLGLDERVWVGFVGTVQHHKGVDDLVRAVAAAQGCAPGLLLMGLDERQRDARTVAALARELLPPNRVRVVGPFETAGLAARLSAVDVVALPSRPVPAAEGQLPAKLLDAMAMARPVVVTDVGDMPEVLGDGGIVVPAADPAALQAAIELLAMDAGLRRALGDAGRRRLVEHFSLDAGRRTLRALLDRTTAPAF